MVRCGTPPIPQLELWPPHWPHLQASDRTPLREPTAITAQKENVMVTIGVKRVSNGSIDAGLDKKPVQVARNPCK